MMRATDKAVFDKITYLSASEFMSASACRCRRNNGSGVDPDGRPRYYGTFSRLFNRRQPEFPAFTISTASPCHASSSSVSISRSSEAEK